jgi:TetR/AcrR family transcriptional regulator, transcriptional repressor for nem operon
MARIVNPEEYEIRRKKILTSAERLIYTQGYEQVSIQDILRELKISKGAFYHYFDSKQALLEAIIERMANQVLQLLQPIVQDQHLSAPEKLHRVFDKASRWKTDRREVLLSMINIWYADENATLRHKAQAALLPPIADILTDIIRQGIGEGAFHTAFPDQVSTILFALLQSFGDSLVPMLVQVDPEPSAKARLEELSASHQDAVERILGAKPGSLPLFDTSILREWFPLPEQPKTTKGTI